MKHVCLLVQETYRPGDLPPEGYLAWHEWADVQYKAGIKQVECGACGKWKTPQELSTATIITHGKNRYGDPMAITRRVCTKCDAKA